MKAFVILPPDWGHLDMVKWIVWLNDTLKGGWRLDQTRDDRLIFDRAEDAIVFRLRFGL